MIKQDSLSHIGNYFEGKSSGLTWQEIKLVEMSKYSKILDVSNPKEILKFKRSFLIWQAKESPSCPMTKKCLSVALQTDFVIPFSHSNDFTWDSIDSFINTLVSKDKNLEKLKSESRDIGEEFPF
jgi:hypothetical protein